MTDFRSKDFAAEVEAHLAVKKFLGWVGILAFGTIACYLVYMTTIDPNAISSFFEHLLGY
jgi:hypothetical protein